MRVVWCCLMVSMVLFGADGEHQRSEGVLPLLLDPAVTEALDVTPGQEVWLEVAYMEAPEGDVLVWEPAEKLWWLHDTPLLLLGSTGSPVPAEVMRRGVSWVRVFHDGQSSDLLTVYPRRQALWVTRDADVLTASMSRLLPGVDSIYLSQVANFLAGNLASLDVVGTSYSISGYGPVINGAGEWTGEPVVEPQPGFTIFHADQGITTADQVNDQLSVVGAGIVSTEIAGDTLIVHALEGDGDATNELQNVFITVAGDDGITTADSLSDTLTVTGLGSVTTRVSGDSLMIEGTGGKWVRDFVVSDGAEVNAGDVVSYLEGTIRKGIQVGTDFLEGPPTDLMGSNEAGELSLTRLTHTQFAGAYVHAVSGVGYAFVGSVSGDAVTSLEKTSLSGLTSSLDVAGLSDGQWVVAYRDEEQGGQGTVRVGFFNDGYFTLGPEQTFSTGAVTDLSVAKLSPTRVLIAYVDESNAQSGTAVLGDLSRDQLVLGSPVVFNASATYELSAAGLSEERFVVAYDDGHLSGEAIVGQVDGDNLSFGSSQTFFGHHTRELDAISISSDVFVIAFTEHSADALGCIIAGSLNGETVEFGELEYLEVSGASSHVVQVTGPQRMVWGLVQMSQNQGVAVPCDISGTQITVWEPHVWATDVTTDALGLAALDEVNLVGGFSQTVDVDVKARLKTLQFQGSGTFIGIAGTAGTSGESIPVILGGVSNVHHDLDSGSRVFASLAGDVTDVATDHPLGLALSPTEILLAPLLQ